MITYLQFVTDIPTLGTYWSRDKHSKDWRVEEKGSWFVLTNIPSERRYRVPITSVMYVSETPVENTSKGKV